jgi:Yip1 domain
VTPTRPPSARKPPGFIERARQMLFQPREAWQRTNGEFNKVSGIFRSYVIPLSAIPPVAYVLGVAIFQEQGTMFGTIEASMGAAVQDAVIRYVLGLAGVFLLAVVLDLLAPAFAGNANRVQALKVAAYGNTAAWLFGILAIVPRLGRFSIIGMLWTLYLVYLGAPLLMKIPTDRQDRITAFGLIAAAATAIVALLVEGLRILTAS